jgi:hypothetical protein
MDIENLIGVFERKLSIQRYSTSSIKNYSSVVRSFLQVAEKRFSHPDKLSELEIEKYVNLKIRPVGRKTICLKGSTVECIPLIVFKSSRKPPKSTYIKSPLEFL